MADHDGEHDAHETQPGTEPATGTTGTALEPASPDAAGAAPSSYPSPQQVRGAVAPGDPGDAPRRPQHGDQVPVPPVQHHRPAAPERPVPRPANRTGGSTGGNRKEGSEIAPEARRSMGKYLLLVLAAVLATSLRLPWTIAALVLAVLAIVVGIRLLLASRGKASAVWNPLVIASLAMSGFVALTSGATMISWNAQIALQECQDRALTAQAQAQCQAEFSSSLLGRFTSGG